MITPKDIEKKTMTESKRKEAHNSYFAFYIGRPISYVCTIPFLYTSITPNAVTIMSIICAMIGFVFVSFGQSLPIRMIGFLFFFMWNIGDGIDGNIARYKGIKSANGDLLDTLGGYLAMVLILLSVGNAASIDNRSLLAIPTSVVTAIAGVSAIETLIPRLLMHRKNAMNKDSDAEKLKDKSTYSIPKIVMLNICDPAGFQQVFMMLAIVLGLTSEFTAAYFFINTIVMIYSIKSLLD